MWYYPPRFFLEIAPDVVQLTPDEVRMERARQLSILLERPTRVRGNKVEVLLGENTWAEQK